MSGHLGLEPDATTRRIWLEAAMTAAFNHLASRDVAHNFAPFRTNEMLPEQPLISEEPLKGGAEAAISAIVRAADVAVDTTAPGYFGYIPGGGVFATAIADFLADVFNRYTGLSAAAPALVQLEKSVLSWLALQFGYSNEATGLFTSGGSLATFAAIAAARDIQIEASIDLRKAVGYTSAQAHASVSDAFRLAGLSVSNLRVVPTDATFRLQPERLREMVREDRTRGLRPFVVIATAGTTNTGAIDPLRDIAAFSSTEGLWLHVDAAYGGAFVLCDEGRQRLRGIELADSITFDPHKGMFLPYGTGCLLFRKTPPLQKSRDQGAQYLQDLQSKTGEINSHGSHDFRLELSRPCRGLRLWLPLMLHGAGAFRDALTEKLMLAAAFHQGLMNLVAKGLQIEIVAFPQLTVIPFRLRRRPTESVHEWNARNGLFLKAINSKLRSFLSSTTLPSSVGEVHTLRVCILSYRTHMREIDHCLEDIESAALELY